MVIHENSLCCHQKRLNARDAFVIIIQHHGYYCYLKINEKKKKFRAFLFLFTSCTLCIERGYFHSGYTHTLLFFVVVYSSRLLFSSVCFKIIFFSVISLEKFFSLRLFSRFFITNLFQSRALVIVLVCLI